MPNRAIAQLFDVDVPVLHVPDNYWPLPAQFIGLEFELENGNNCPQLATWRVKNDGSLRNVGREYVSRGPLCGKTLVQSLNEFFDCYHHRTPEWEANERTGFHVHMDFTQPDDTTELIRSFVAVYFLCEGMLYRFAGEDRKYSGYCYSLDEAAAPLNFVFATADPTIWARKIHGSTRYYGLNLSAMAKYGTIEFRHMPMVFDRIIVERWIKLLMHLKRFAAEYCNEAEGDGPERVLGHLGKVGVQQFFQDVFKDEYPNIAKLINDQDVFRRAVTLEAAIVPEDNKELKILPRVEYVAKNPILIKKKLRDKKAKQEAKIPKPNLMELDHALRQGFMTKEAYLAQREVLRAADRQRAAEREAQAGRVNEMERVRRALNALGDEPNY